MVSPRSFLLSLLLCYGIIHSGATTKIGTVLKDTQEVLCYPHDSVAQVYCRNNVSHPATSVLGDRASTLAAQSIMAGIGFDYAIDCSAIRTLQASRIPEGNCDLLPRSQSCPFYAITDSYGENDHTYSPQIWNYMLEAINGVITYAGFGVTFLLALCLVSGILLGTSISASIRRSYLAPVLIYVDFFFHSVHVTPEGSSPIRKKTTIGGIFSLALSLFVVPFVLAVVLSQVLGSQHALEEFSYQEPPIQSQTNLSMALQVGGYWGNCTATVIEAVLTRSLEHCRVTYSPSTISSGICNIDLDCQNVVLYDAQSALLVFSGPGSRASLFSGAVSTSLTYQSTDLDESTKCNPAFVLAFFFPQVIVDLWQDIFLTYVGVAKQLSGWATSLHIDLLLLQWYVPWLFVNTSPNGGPLGTFWPFPHSYLTTDGSKSLPAYYQSHNTLYQTTNVLDQTFASNVMYGSIPSEIGFDFLKITHGDTPFSIIYSGYVPYSTTAEYGSGTTLLDPLAQTIAASSVPDHVELKVNINPIHGSIHYSKIGFSLPSLLTALAGVFALFSFCKAAMIALFAFVEGAFIQIVYKLVGRKKPALFRRLMLTQGILHAAEQMLELKVMDEMESVDPALTESLLANPGEEML